ncbi:hypothetical protein Clow_01652 [Corynebacterium lowii]|uniref:Uncharacterized protein n=1 Tax=Corynebacterium lowii TaxID=1544413 RepID=A0A0Q0Z8J4_9CORY|nr:hypothetical protein Clow_01652 [Corynebacterium lowii]
MVLKIPMRTSQKSILVRKKLSSRSILMLLCRLLSLHVKQ